MKEITIKKLAVAAAFVLVLLGGISFNHGVLAPATADTVDVVERTENAVVVQVDDKTTLTAYDDGTVIRTEEGEWFDEEIGASELIEIL